MRRNTLNLINFTISCTVKCHSDVVVLSCRRWTETDSQCLGGKRPGCERQQPLVEWIWNGATRHAGLFPPQTIWWAENVWKHFKWGQKFCELEAPLNSRWGSNIKRNFFFLKLYFCAQKLKPGRSFVFFSFMTSLYDYMTNLTSILLLLSFFFTYDQWKLFWTSITDIYNLTRGHLFDSLRSDCMIHLLLHDSCLILELALLKMSKSRNMIKNFVF